MSCSTALKGYHRSQGERGAEGSREIRGEKYIHVHVGDEGLLEEFREEDKMIISMLVSSPDPFRKS